MKIWKNDIGEKLKQGKKGNWKIRTLGKMIFAENDY